MKLLRNAGSKHYLTQLQELGFLIHWESLLSTHGDENGMLEDFIVAIYDLNQLKFKVSSKSSSVQCSLFWIDSLNSHAYTHVGMIV